MTTPTTKSPLSALPSESFAQFHRARKVTRLAMVLVAAGESAADVLDFTASERTKFERMADVKAGSEITWGAVAIMLDDIRPGTF